MNALVIFIGALVIGYLALILCYYLDLPLWVTLPLHLGIIFYGCYRLSLMIAPNFSEIGGVWILTVAIGSGFVVFSFVFLKRS